MDLAKLMAQLPEPPDGKEPYWEHWQHELWKLAQEQEPDSFPSWPPVYYTMLVRHWDMETRLNVLKQRSDWPKWELGLIMPSVGHPPDWHRETAYSGNLIEQAYHLHMWEEKTGLRLQDMKSIVEVGGGYGAMALLCRRLGYAYPYTILDVPEFSLLQQWFLEQEHIEGIRYDSAITPHDKADLLIACYSVSELDMELRRRILQNYDARNYLFLYSAEWAEHDNASWFGYIASQWSKMKWHFEPIVDRPDWYAFGWEG